MDVAKRFCKLGQEGYCSEHKVFSRIDILRAWKSWFQARSAFEEISECWMIGKIKGNLIRTSQCGGGDPMTSQSYRSLIGFPHGGLVYPEFGTIARLLEFLI